MKADRDHGNVIVNFVVNDGVEIGKEATAEIALETLLGAKFVRLDGPVEPDYMEDLPEAERVIRVDRTKTPFDVFELTDVSTRNIEALHTEQLNTLINDLADITEGKGQSITDLIDGLDRVAAAINDRDVQLRELLERADRSRARWPRRTRRWCS